MLRNNLRKRARISYYEPEERDLDEYIFCTDCGDYVVEYCTVHGAMLVIPDTKVSEDSTTSPLIPRAALTIPDVFLQIAPSIIPGAGLGVFTRLALPADVRFGPYTGDIGKEITSPYCWQIHSGNRTQSHVVDAANPNRSNWMRYVNCSRHWNEQNLLAFQYRGQIYYRTLKIIPRHTELLVYYGTEYAKELGIDIRAYNDPKKYANFITRTVAKDHAAAAYANKDVEVSTNISHEHKPQREEDIIKIHFETDSVTFEYLNNTNNMFNKNITNYDFNNLNNNNKYNGSELELTRDDLTIENVNNLYNSDSIYNESQFNNSETNFIYKIADQLNIDKNTSADNYTNINIEKEYNSNTILYKITDKGYIQCQMCAYHTYLESSIKLHIKLHDPNRQFECYICHYKYIDRTGLKRHIGSVHCPKYQCTKCNVKFSRHIYLEKHQVNVHNYPVGNTILSTDGNKNKVAYIDIESLNTDAYLQNTIQDNSEMNNENIHIDNDVNKMKNTQTNFPCTHPNINSNKEQHIYNLSNKITEVDTNINLDKTQPSQATTFSDNNSENFIRNFQEYFTTENEYVKCKACGFETFYRNTFKIKSHIQMHDERRRFSCHLCHYRFSDHRHLKRHITSVHAETKTSHLNIEDMNEKTIKIEKCNICGYKTTSTQHFKKHILLHDERRLFQCKFCNFRYSNQYSLTRHVTTVHKDKNNAFSKRVNTDFLIEQIDHSTPKDITQFELAKNYIASANKIIRNDDAKETLKNIAIESEVIGNDEANKNIDSTIKESIFDYKLANNNTTSVNKIIKSDDTKESIQNTVTVINNADTSKTRDNIIKQNISNIKYTRNYFIFECHYCNFKSSSEDAIKRHVNMHDSSRKLVCPMCEYRFKTGNGLRSHIKSVHYKEKPYKCYLCEAAYGNSENLKVHLIQVHNR